MLEILEKVGWPISNEDVMLMEDEILTGLTYLQQATELQVASKEEARKICPFQLIADKEVSNISNDFKCYFSSTERSHLT